MRSLPWRCLPANEINSRRRSGTAAAGRSASACSSESFVPSIFRNVRHCLFVRLHLWRIGTCSRGFYTINDVGFQRRRDCQVARGHVLGLRVSLARGHNVFTKWRWGLKRRRRRSEIRSRMMELPLRRQSRRWPIRNHVNRVRLGSVTAAKTGISTIYMLRLCSCRSPINWPSHASQLPLQSSDCINFVALIVLLVD